MNNLKSNISMEDLLGLRIPFELDRNSRDPLIKIPSESYSLERIANASSKPVVMGGTDILVKIPGIQEPYREVEIAELTWSTPITLDLAISGRYGEEVVKDRNIIRFKKAIITAKAIRISAIQRLEEWIEENRRVFYEPNVKLYLRNGKTLELPQVNGVPTFYIINGHVSYKS